MLSPRRNTRDGPSFTIWSRTARCLLSPTPASPRKAMWSSWAAAGATAKEAASSAAANVLANVLMSGARGQRDPRQLVVQVNRRLHALHQVAEVEALVLRVRVAQRVLDPHEEAGRATEQVRERLHEADGAPRPDHRRLPAESGLERAPRGVEGGAVGIGSPPGG